MKKRKIPQRMCVGCMEMKPKKELIRIVRTPDLQVLIDASGKKSGRGVYICPNGVCLNKALKTNRLEKNLQHEVSEEVITRLKVGLGCADTTS